MIMTQKILFKKALLICLFIIGIFFPSSTIFADDVVYEWAKGFGGADSDTGSSVVVDADGNTYTFGSFNGTVDFDPGAGTSNLISAGSIDAFISKLDINGDFVWAKRLGGADNDASSSIVLDSDGNIYLMGFFEGTADFDPGAGTSNLISAGSNEVFISKLDSNGDFVWAKRLGGAGAEFPGTITLDTNGNIYTTGRFVGTADFDPGVGTSNLVSVGSSDVFISKLDNDGNFVWAKRLGGVSFDNGIAITSDSDGNIYTTGYFAGTADFDPGVGTSNLVSAGGDDIFISKLDSDGNFVLAKKLGGAGTDYSASIVLDSDGNIYTTGYFAGTADFDPGVGTSNLVSAGGDDIFISKLDSDGNFVLAKRMGGVDSEGSNAIILDSDGNIYTTGYFAGTADFDPGVGTSNLISAGSIDVFISKLDINGDFIWVKQIGGTDVDISYGITLDSYGNTYTTGFFDSTADLDPGVGTRNLVSVGSDDVFILKLSPTSAPIVISTAASNITKDSASLNGNITDTGGVDATERGFEHGITNSYGITVAESSGPYSTGVFSTDLIDLECGTTYYFRSYAINTEGTSYGLETTFSTSDCPRSSSGSTPSSRRTSATTQSKTSTASTPDTLNSEASPETLALTVDSEQTPPVFKSLNNFKQGVSGEDIKELQKYLNTHGYPVSLAGPGSLGLETNFFGPKTKAAVILFQKAHSLVPDGIVGPMTKNKMI